ncbi:glycine--tRNA ligase subunit beta [Pelomonas sp. V22]|uniref:glycine--tRNA ligase subunit beta n=1 Tax=Pelomonas sp. V22 TaxID=2822139 RepID=UPI0024A7DB09|nr:glycine--tRNA ligase subunit beta [Pelomonas sp. V22]MDI4634976.1 glycine--tRNA ligase subunit beta [Pelomonas sp. V22]
MSTKNLLIELFVEELPPKALKKLGESFAGVLAESLKAQGLVSADAVATSFASPRRLGLHLTQVAAKAADRAMQQKLMPVAVALDASGNATPALLKKLAALGADASVVPQLKRAPDGKADALFLDQVVAGATLAEGLQKALDESLAKLPIPKVMTYQLADGWSDVKFVRPAHGLVALHGAEIVPVQALGLTSGRVTQGHRFEAQTPEVSVESADSYASQLREQGAVIASFAERRAEIQRQLKAAAGDLKPIDDEALLDEVTALVERPNVLACQFEPEFLAVPQECLILTMKANQKYFPLLDAEGKLTHKFLVVSNISPADASAVIGGNERVVRPRLSDAKFFFDQDRKKTLAERVPGLAKVVYHGKLGTQGERVERVRAIAGFVAAQIGADVQLADRAALLAKADLLTDMVGEFPELQGVMGGYYARHDGENEAVAKAIAAQYVVRRDEEAHASNLVGEALLLADRIETLVGIWGIGLKPTGEKDPFALRRHALGVIRSIELIAAAAAMAGKSLAFQLEEALQFAAATFAAGTLAAETVAEVRAFIYDRYQNQLAVLFDGRSVDAVLSQQPSLQEVVKRLEAVRAFAALPEAESLAAANKRIANILKKIETPVEARIDEALLKEPPEQALAAALKNVQPLADGFFHNGEYAASLRELAALKAPVDAFFDGVMVNADDAALRANRQGLLKTLHEAMNRVADLSRLAS